jgi:hypothetical protein
MDLSILIKILIGVALLLAGRRLFWLMIGGIGFIGGLALSTILFHGSSTEVQLIVALAAGIAGVLLAIFIQHSAIWLIGFVAGGFLLVAVAHMFSANVWFIYVIAFVMGGFLGALLISMMFELALVLLSSAIGSILITQSLITENSITSTVLLIVLFVFGVVFQNIKRRKPKTA